jgi:hypothetical protein
LSSFIRPSIPPDFSSTSAAPLELTTAYKMSTSSSPSLLEGKYPAKQHLKKVLAELEKTNSFAGIIYLESQKTRLLEDCDAPEPFRSAFLPFPSHVTSLHVTSSHFTD